jgi:hypothetical protein
VRIFVGLLIASALVMAFVGWAANAYWVPAACLLLQAVLLWSGRWLALFKWILIVNQLSGLVLILMLWLGDGLGVTKLDIAGMALLVNLLCGGPLLSILAVGLIPSLHHGRPVHSWFGARQPADSLVGARTA